MSFGLLDEQSVCSRKQSASDLQSRLKTRKLLGVGELARDNGQIYRSKISQLLGINESLYVRLPRGLLYWNSVNTIYFYLVGALCIFFPSVGIHLDMGFSSDHDDTLFVIRIYGVALVAFGLMFRSILLQRETRSEIATLLLVTAILQGLQFTVCLLSSRLQPLQAIIRLGMIAGNLVYHTFVDSQGGIYRQLCRLLDDYSIISTPVVEKPKTEEKKDPLAPVLAETSPEQKKLD